MEKLTTAEITQSIATLKIIEPQTQEIKKQIQKLQQQLTNC
jgi:hypothetical protein